MHKVEIKPISVNACFQGRRFKTKEYKRYEKELGLMLPKIKVPEKNICLEIEAGLSTANADIDNIAKPVVDIMQKKYGFNDRYIEKLVLKKEKVKKGEEYLKFRFDKI